MDSAGSVVVRGTFSKGVFVATDPLPDAEGPAELIVHAQSTQKPRPSIYDVFGKAKQPRSAEELDAQLAEERAAWNDE